MCIRDSGQIEGAPHARVENGVIGDLQALGGDGDGGDVLHAGGGRVEEDVQVHHAGVEGEDALVHHALGGEDGEAGGAAVGLLDVYKRQEHGEEAEP